METDKQFKVRIKNEPGSYDTLSQKQNKQKKKKHKKKTRQRQIIQIINPQYNRLTK